MKLAHLAVGSFMLIAAILMLSGDIINALDVSFGDYAIYLIFFLLSFIIIILTKIISEVATHRF